MTPKQGKGMYKNLFCGCLLSVSMAFSVSTTAWAINVAPDMNIDQLTQSATTAFQSNEPIADVVKTLLDAGIDAGDTVQALIGGGYDTAQVIRNVISAGGDTHQSVCRAAYMMQYPATEIIRNAARSAGADAAIVDRSIAMCMRQMHPGAAGSAASPS